jgi:hypothetical protein
VQSVSIEIWISFVIGLVLFREIYLSMCVSTTLFLSLHTVGRTPWTGDQSVAMPLPAHTEQQKHRINSHRHPCLKWDSNPRSQCSSVRRQFMP